LSGEQHSGRKFAGFGNSNISYSIVVSPDQLQQQLSSDDTFRPGYSLPSDLATAYQLCDLLHSHAEEIQALGQPEEAV